MKIMLFIFFASSKQRNKLFIFFNKTRVSKHNFSVMKKCTRSMCVYSHNTRTANIGIMSSKINRELAEPVEATQAYLL